MLMERSGIVVIQYYIDDKMYRDRWDESSVNLRYVLQALAYRKATRIQILYS